MIGGLDKKKPDTSNFINANNFNKLTKTSSNARMAEGPKDIATKDQVETALDVRDKNRNEIKNFKMFDLSCFFFFFW